MLGLAKDMGWLAFVQRHGTAPITLRGRSIRLPSLRDALGQIAFGLEQISLMTTILYLFMPPELSDVTSPPHSSRSAGSPPPRQRAMSPRGWECWKRRLSLMLPHVQDGHVAGAVLAYRGVYELIPLRVWRW